MAERYAGAPTSPLATLDRKAGEEFVFPQGFDLRFAGGHHSEDISHGIEDLQLVAWFLSETALVEFYVVCKSIATIVLLLKTTASATRVKSGDLMVCREYRWTKSSNPDDRREVKGGCALARFTIDALGAKTGKSPETSHTCAIGPRSTSALGAKTHIAPPSPPTNPILTDAHGAKD
jgi:hypothetical protein